MTEREDKLMEEIGYRFQNSGLLHTALTHSTYTNDHGMHRQANNERLEFLGDAVLELSSSDILYSRYPEMDEGDLTKLRASLVCEPTLADAARKLHLGNYLLLGRGEKKSGGYDRDSTLSDALEAVIGAIYLDGGFDSAKEFVSRFLLEDVEHKTLFYDSKTILQELVQGKIHGTLTYVELREEGPDHDKTFWVEAVINGRPYGKGRGRSKKIAEQHAAYQTLLILQKENEKEDK